MFPRLTSPVLPPYPLHLLFQYNSNTTLPNKNVDVPTYQHTVSLIWKVIIACMRSAPKPELVPITSI